VSAPDGIQHEGNVMKLRFTGVLGICLLAFIATGCGSSGNTSTSSTQAPQTTSSTSRSSQNVAADKALAKSASLRLSDFPTGWTSEPNQQDNSSAPQLQAQLAGCLRRSVVFFNTKGPPQNRPRVVV